MISFFFASMVALTFTGTQFASSDTIRTLEPDLVYDSDNTLIGYYFDNQNDWYPNWEYRNDNVNNSVDYYIDTGVGTIGFRLICDYGTQAGSSSTYTSIKFGVLGESVATNLYLTDISLEYNAGGGNWGTFDYSENVYFNGQSTYYYDDESGNLTSDIPYSYTTNFECCINFKVLCLDHTLLEGQWYNNGYNAGYAAGYSDGSNDGYNSGYSYGYDDGYQQGYSTDSTVTSIFSGILQVALVPINFFLAIFNFEILGINISGFIKALFTIAITIIVIRTIFGGKGAGDGGE